MSCRQLAIRLLTFGSDCSGPKKFDLITAFALAVYIYFGWIFSYFFGFVVFPGGLVAGSGALRSMFPYSVEGPGEPGGGRAPHAAPEAAATNSAALLLFAVAHSAMARAGFKDRVYGERSICRRRLERPVYCLVSTALLHALMRYWRPVGTRTLWHLGSPTSVPGMVLVAMSMLGFVLAFIATFCVDHWELVGVRQALDLPCAPSLEERSLYRCVRHPMMTGLLVAFWSTPIMTFGRLLLCACMTAYICVGVFVLEEADYRRVFGDAYTGYASRVPGLCPLPALFGVGSGGALDHDRRGGEVPAQALGIPE